jgi:hypothetical protein
MKYFRYPFLITRRITVGVIWIARNSLSNQSFDTCKNLPDGTGRDYKGKKDIKIFSQSNLL